MEKDEYKLEQRCKRRARLFGWVAWKNEKNKHKGIPDDSFLNKDGRFLLIEFKKDEKQKPRPEQEIWLRTFPKTAFLIGDYEHFCRLLDIPP